MRILVVEDEPKAGEYLRKGLTESGFVVDLARYGLSVGELQDVIGTALGAEMVTTTVEGRERFGVTVRYPRELRSNPQQIGTVTLAHGPVKSLKWPAMTMSFAVKDKMLFDKLAVDKKVKVEFIQQDADYIVTAVE